MDEPVGTVRSCRSRRKVPFDEPRSVKIDVVVAKGDARVGARDVAVLGKQDVAPLAPQDDGLAEERKGRAVHVSPDDHERRPQNPGLGCP